MSIQDYDQALDAVLEHEGGYTNDAHDSGGPTNWGITLQDARMYWKHNATARDVRLMPLSIAKGIYKSKYWDFTHGDDLPAGVDYAVFDYGVNSGVHRAAMVLQRLVGAVDDGRIGPITLDAVKHAKPLELINAICDERISFLRRLSNWQYYGRGWTRRVAEVRTLALTMASEASGTTVNTPATIMPIPGAISGGGLHPQVLV